MDTKKCCHCKEELSLDSFQKNRAVKDGLQHRCKGCTKKAHVSTYAKRSHLWKSRAKLWRRDNRDKVNAASRARRAKNPERGRAENRRWRETTNPFSVAARAAYHRAAELNVISTLTTDEWRKIVEDCNFVCHLCGEKTVFDLCSPLRLSLDHVLPMSRGGSNSADNVLPAHRRCNQNRSDMTLEEFDIWLDLIYLHRRSGHGES